MQNARILPRICAVISFGFMARALFSGTDPVDCRFSIRPASAWFWQERDSVGGTPTGATGTIAEEKKEAAGEGADRDMRGGCAPRNRKFRRRVADGDDRVGRATQRLLMIGVEFVQIGFPLPLDGFVSSLPDIAKSRGCCNLVGDGSV
jgi:hypothetical protein